MELREWLIILGLVLVAIILVDGVRRLQRQRRGLRMDLSRDIDASEPARDPDDIAREERMSWELPNGGARVVANDSRARGDSPPRASARHDRSRPVASDRSKPLYADEDAFDGEDEVYLEDVNDAEVQYVEHNADDVAPRLSTDPLDDDFEAPRNARSPRYGHDPLDEGRLETHGDELAFDDEPVEPAPRRRDELGQRIRSVFGRGGEVSRLPVRSESAHDDDRRERRAPSQRRAPDPETDWQDERPFEEPAQALFDRHAPVRESDEPRHPAVERAARGMIRGEKAREALRDAEEVVVISVLSKDEAGFEGTDLLQLVLACGLRFDDEGVFHRFETESSQSPLQFSMVNVLKPGIFDLDAIETQAVPGVTLLMPLPGAQAPREAFEAMYETAMVLVRNLGGELKDENRSVMTAQTVSFARQRVHEFERRWRLHRHQSH